MSINAGFSLFKPNPLYRNLREDTAKNDDLPTTATTLPTSEFTLGLPPLDTRPKSVLSFDVDELDELIDSSQDELVQELQREKEELQRLNAELQKDKAELLRQRAGDSELAQLVGELATQKTKLQNQNSELQKQNNALQKKLEEHMQETQRHVEKAQATEEMEALVAQLKARQEELQAQCEAFEQTNEALKSQNDDLRAANELVCRQKDEIMAMQKEQQAQFELMQQQHAQSTVADEVAELLTAMEAEKKAMKKQNTELQDELDEVYGVMEEMSVHVEAMEAHQQSMVAYVNKLLTDVKNVKRRAVWQKIEYDKERQELVEELHTWKRRAEDLKATENDAVAAAEANAAYEAACLNQTIEQLQSEIVTLKTQLDETAEELARRGGTPEEAAETEQMLDALKELALDLKAQADEATAALEKQKAEAAEDMKQLQEIVSDLRQKSTKQTIAHDKERQELMEELHMWKNRALEAVTGARDITNSEADTTTASSISTDGDAEAHVVDNQISPIDEEATEASHVEDNQQDDQSVNQVDVMKSGSLDDPTSAAQETNQDETNNQTSEETVEASPSEDTADNGKPPVPSDNQDEDADAASNAKTFDDYAEGDSDTVPESPLHSPHRSDSFFTRVTRTFSFRSRTDSISSIPDYGTPSRTRADSIASSTTSAASTSRTKKASTPVLQHTRNDYLRQQEPFRMNSFKHFL